MRRRENAIDSATNLKGGLGLEDFKLGCKFGNLPSNETVLGQDSLDFPFVNCDAIGFYKTTHTDETTAFWKMNEPTKILG